MAEDGVPTSQIQTYHCLCTTLILTTTHDLQSLPRRAEPIQDSATILPPPINISRTDEVFAEGIEPADSGFLNVSADRKPIVIRREDGFEKRTLLRCGRCKLPIGYQLDAMHSKEHEANSRPVYLLPGGLITTPDMAKGVRAETPAWAAKDS